MSPSASSVAADRDVFHFTVPLSAEEFLTLAGIGPSASVGRTPWRSSGWALVDAGGGVWGWHPVDADAADWCDAPAALAGFIIEPRTRARLVGDGFHVVADEGGALLNTLLRSPALASIAAAAQRADQAAQPANPAALGRAARRGADRRVPAWRPT